MTCPHLRLTAAVLALGMATAHATGNVEISTPTLAVPVAPGASVAIPIHFHNIDTQASDVDEVEFFTSGSTLWPITVSGPSGCGPISSNGYYSFPMVSLPAGGTLDCVFTVTRPADSVDDATLELWTSVDFNISTLRIGLGKLADIALSNELVSYSVDPDGTTHGVFRLTARNVGSTPVGEFDAMTCSYSGAIDNAIEGGCAPTTSQCALGMIPFEAQGAHLPALAPGEQTSCLINLRGTTQYPEFNALSLDQEPDWNIWLIDSATGRKVYDPYEANNQTTLMAPGPAGGITAPAPTLSPFALALLGAGLLLTAAWASRRPRGAP